MIDKPILILCSISVPPENVRKDFQGVEKWNIELIILVSGICARENQSDLKHGTSYKIAAVENYRSQSEDVKMFSFPGGVSNNCWRIQKRLKERTGRVDYELTIT